MVKYNRLKKINIKNSSRLRRKILAEWQQINISDPDVYQYLTDAMLYGYAVQINYEGSGWRNIQPYGWNTRKDGNNLLMSYRDNGEIRSYRLDRILDLYIDYDNQIATNNNQQMQEDEEMQIYEDIMNNQEQENLDMPDIPGQDTNFEQPGIYDEELNILNNDLNFDNQNINEFDQNINDQDLNNQNINEFDQNINNEENDNNGQQI